MNKRRSKSGRGIYTAPILVGLTPEQHKAVKAAADGALRSVADWARLILLDAAKKFADKKTQVTIEQLNNGKLP